MQLQSSNAYGFYLTGIKSTDIVSTYRQAYRLGLIPHNTRVYLQKGDTVYAKITDKGLYIGRRFLNGNGVHDIALLELPSLTPLGRLIEHDYPEGIHRDTLVLTNN